jgi:hypothetical protein
VTQASVTDRVLTVVGVNFQAGETVRGTLYSDPVDIGTQTANASGQVTFTYTLPANFPPGAHRVVLTAQSGTAELAFTIPGSSLPDTGAGATRTVAILALLLIATAAAMLNTGLRLRRRS